MAVEVIHTVGVGGFYSDLSIWEAAQQRDLVALDEIAVAEVIGTVVAGYPHLDISGWVMDSTHYALIRAVAGSEFNPLTLTGSQITTDLTEAYFGIVVRAAHTLHIDSLGMSSKDGQSMIHSLQEYIEINNCHISNCGILDGWYKSTINNSVIIPSYASAGTGGGSPYRCTLQNVTIIQKSGLGSYSGDICALGCTSKNTVAYNGNTKATYDIYHSGSRVTCAQNENGSASLGTGNIDNLLTTDFTDYANGDYSVSSTSQLIDAGTDLSSEFTTDIVGTVRG